MKRRYIQITLILSVATLMLLLSTILIAQPTIERIQRNIIGGVQAQEGAWPWMVGLLDSLEPNTYAATYCGGILIHPQWVLTVAHCVIYEDGTAMYPFYLDILVGADDLYEKNQERIRASRIILHPRYNRKTNANDLALIKLEKPAAAELVQLPGETFDDFLYDEGIQAIAIGWGADKYLSEPNKNNLPSYYPSVLKQVSMPIVSHDICKRRNDLVMDTMICAGQLWSPKTPCFSDSGGPLVTKDPRTGKWILIGVIGWGIGGCSGQGGYSVYNRVSRYSWWISQQICQESERPKAPYIQITSNGNWVNLAFDPIANAEGYRLYWAPYPEMKPINQRDLGDRTSYSTTLPWDSKYFVAIEPYNQNCLGSFSNIEPVVIQ